MRTITNGTLSTATAALVAGLLTVPTATSASETSAVHDLDASIVWVAVQFPAVVTVPWQDGTTSDHSTTVGAGCTGFFVSGEGDIATAGHCVEADSSTRVSAIANVMEDLMAEGWDLTGLTPTNVDWGVGVGEPTAYVGQRSGIEGGALSGEPPMIAQIVDFQGFASGDNALLRVADLDGTVGLPVGADTPVRGEQVTAIGFPASVTDVSDPLRQAPSYKTGTVSSRQFTERGVPNTEIDAAVSPGMSGGPTVDGDGAVIGVNSFKVNGESQPFNFITDTKTLRDFLTGNGVEVELADPPSTETTEESDAGTGGPLTDSGTSTGGPVEGPPMTPGSSTADGSVPLADNQPPAPSGSQGSTTSLLWVGGGLVALMILVGGLLLGRFVVRPRPVA